MRWRKNEDHWIGTGRGAEFRIHSEPAGGFRLVQHYRSFKPRQIYPRPGLDDLPIATLERAKRTAEAYAAER